MFQKPNVDQINVIERIVRETQHHNTGSNVFCLMAHADCGKTIVLTATIHKMNALKYTICIITAFSGIAST